VGSTSGTGQELDYGRELSDPGIAEFVNKKRIREARSVPGLGTVRLACWPPDLKR